jgi:hypothetical protein
LWKAESIRALFVTLMRDLSPFVLLLVDPANHSRRQDRSGEVTRSNIDFVLNGHPEAVTLFDGSEVVGSIEAHA